MGDKQLGPVGGIGGRDDTRIGGLCSYFDYLGDSLELKTGIGDQEHHFGSCLSHNNCVGGVNALVYQIVFR
jgi:hypothetical protein